MIWLHAKYKLINDAIFVCIFLGWVPSVHWGPPTIRKVFLVHVVQPTGGQEALLQEAREADESGRGTSVQRGITGS